MIPNCSSSHRRLLSLLSTQALFAFCVLFLCKGVTAFPSNNGSLFRLQPHRFNGSLFKHAGKPVSLDHLAHIRWRDRNRHNRVLAATSNTTIDPIAFPLGGVADPNSAGLYFTEIELGTPPSKFYVQVDTGSDLLWVNCASCKTCPKSTGLGVRLALYDPGSSSSSTDVLCGDSYCNDASSGGCQAEDVCGYQLGYGDGSTSQGYFVRDTLLLNMVSGNKSTNASATVAFGCGTKQDGELRNSDQALDGIMGFGQASLSVISQIMDKNEAVGVFAHCLEGEGDGGGILTIGEVQTPGLVYTPIIPNQPHYNVNLTSVSVNHRSISIDSSVSQHGGTIIDSGTTLSYFSDSLYQQLLQAVFDAVQLDTSTFQWEGMICVPYSGSVDDVFPTITFNFDGNGAEMIIRPHEYLVQAEGQPGLGWCMAFQSTGSSSLNLNILGDLVLKDRLVVYDLEKQRIGWVDYDCSSNITVLSTAGQATSILSSSIPMDSAASSIFQSPFIFFQPTVWVLSIVSYFLL